MQELQNLMRTMLGSTFVATNPTANTLLMRAPKRVLDAAEMLVNNLSGGRPEVLLEIRALQLDDSASRQIGINLPLQFNIFNVPTELRKLVSIPGGADAIARLLASGTVNPADLVALAGLLAAAQANQSSPLTQPFGVLGGGRSLTGVGIPGSIANFHFDQSSVKLLQKMTLRAEQGKAASYRVGERYPILTNSFSALTNTPLTSRQTQGVGTQPLVPGVTYEDLGITLKATPNVTASGDINLQLELGIKALAGQTFNGVPTISNREYKGTINVKDGEVSIMAGSMDESESKNVTGMPWLSNIPGLKPLVSNTRKQRSHSDLLFLIIPHIIRLQGQQDFRTETYMDGAQ